MKSLINIFFVCTVFNSIAASSQTLPSKQSAQSELLCQKEWTKRGKLDESMYKDCLKREYDGYHDTLLLIEQYKTQPWIQQVIDFSVSKWTKAGMRNDSMVNFQLKIMIDAWEDLVYESKQSNFDKRKYASCQSEWGVLFHVVRSCYKNN